MCLYDLLNEKYKDYWLEKIYLESDNIVNYLNSLNFREKLGVELFKFLCIISNKEFKEYPNFMEILLNKTDFIKLYKNETIRYIVINYFKKSRFHELKYELSSFDAFIRTIINYIYGVDQIIEIPYLKEKNWDLTYTDEIETVYTKPLRPHTILNKVNYDAFEKRCDETEAEFKSAYEISFKEPSFTLDDYQSGLDNSYSWNYSEYLAYRFGYTSINNKIVRMNDINKIHEEQYNTNRWVSKYDGDGYGLDTLFIGDVFKSGFNKQVGFEVKEKKFDVNGLSDMEIEEQRFNDYGLTYTENQTMRESKNMDYFVFLYSNIKNDKKNNFKCKVLYFDRNINLLYDINNVDDLYDTVYKKECNSYMIVPKQKKIMITNNSNY